MVFHEWIFFLINIIGIGVPLVIFLNRDEHKPQKGTMISLLCVVVLMTAYYVWFFSDVPHCTCIADGEAELAAKEKATTVTITISKKDYALVEDILGEVK